MRLDWPTRRAACALAVAVGLMAVGCHSDTPQVQAPDPGGPLATDTLPFRVDSSRVVAVGSHSSALVASQHVLASAEAFDSFWVEFAPATTRPTVSFQDSLLLAVMLGGRPTSGYAIRIDSLTGAGDTILVHGTHLERLTNCPLLQVETSPFQVVQVPRLAGPFAFVFTTQSTVCPP